MQGWLPIHTAPRDGTIVLLAGLDDRGEVEVSAPMRWNPTRENGLFPGVVGFWELSDGSMTWHDEEHGPTHWQPVHQH